MNVVEFLRAARKRIEKPEHRCRLHFALDGDGKPCAPEDPRAESWCPLGALRAIAEGDEWLSYGDAFRALQAAAPAATTTWGEFMEWTDSATHAEILALYDRAIAEADHA